MSALAVPAPLSLRAKLDVAIRLPVPSTKPVIFAGEPREFSPRYRINGRWRVDGVLLSARSILNLLLDIETEDSPDRGGLTITVWTRTEETLCSRIVGDNCVLDVRNVTRVVGVRLGSENHDGAWVDTDFEAIAENAEFFADVRDELRLGE